MGRVAPGGSSVVCETFSNCERNHINVLEKCTKTYLGITFGGQFFMVSCSWRKAPFSTKLRSRHLVASTIVVTARVPL